MYIHTPEPYYVPKILSLVVPGYHKHNCRTWSWYWLLLLFIGSSVCMGYTMYITKLCKCGIEYYPNNSVQPHQC